MPALTSACSSAEAMVLLPEALRPVNQSVMPLLPERPSAPRG
jgi:hypothetical protein